MLRPKAHTTALERHTVLGELVPLIGIFEGKQEG